MSRRAGRLAAGSVLLALVASGCGVDTQSHPEQIDTLTVPPAPTPTVTVVPDPATTPPSHTGPDPAVMVPAVTATRPSPPVTPG